MDNVWIILVDSHANAPMDTRENAVTLRLVHLFTYKRVGLRWMEYSDAVGEAGFDGSAHGIILFTANTEQWLDEELILAWMA